MKTEDGYIARRCLNGEKADFGFLVDKYREAVYALAYSNVRNFHDAEDITQEVFIKAYKNLHTLGDGTTSWRGFTPLRLTIAGTGSGSNPNLLKANQSKIKTHRRCSAGQWTPTVTN